MAEIFDRNKQNTDLAKIQEIATQFGIEDINNISEEQRQSVIKKLQGQLQQQEVGGNIGSAVGGALSPHTSGRSFFGTPTGVGSVETGSTPTKASPFQELIDLEKFKALKEGREEAGLKREKLAADLEKAREDRQRREDERNRRLGLVGKQPQAKTEVTTPETDITEEAIQREPIPTTTGGLQPEATTTPIQTGITRADTQAAPAQVGDFEEVVTGFDDAGTPITKIQRTQTGEAKGKAKTKWFEEAAERDIKFEVLDPKLRYYMNVGGRAYQELRDEVRDNWGFELNFEKGGFEALKTMAVKNVAMKTKLAPLMFALERLRPELGTELMRQLGAFRSAQMARQFAETLSNFSGDIREDIANMTTTMAKNVANIELIDENGNTIPSAETVERMETAEANLIRLYNKMYRGMKLTTKPYTAKRSLQWLAKNSNFNTKEENIIQNAMSDNPKHSRVDIAAKLIEEGLL